EGAPGHGCGHNLLGAASCAAAVALKRYLETENIPGQIRFYGCPAEENGAGKAFMAREGAFDDLDAALCWHPWNTSDMWSNGSMAMIKVDFHFTGKALPVPADDIRWPHLACDAFEAATLMDTGLKYLGGHLSPGVRIHSAIELENGDPVSTTKEARLRILLRAPSGSLARECYERIIRCSKGAALMSGASVERCFVFGMLDFMPNMVLTRLLGQAFNKAGPPDFDEEDMRFASRLRSTINPGQLLETDSMFNRG
ncbi:MAG: M20/M25/M40 family metallo-hydrolase, partial [Synergistota bacterium]|nr:M20/M25/M40 family metallo-hydrolase [Synergistota bacterium]